jgi:hypothetical protein
MKKIQVDLSKFKVPQGDKTICKTEWQEYARQVVKDFKIIHPYDKIIFRWAKKNTSYLKGKVENLRERSKTKQEDIGTYGRLLTYLLKQK